MRLHHITKQLFDDEGPIRDGTVLPCNICRHCRELRIDGGRSPDVALPFLWLLARKQGAAAAHASPPRLDQREFGLSATRALTPKGRERSP